MTGLVVHQCPKCELRFSFRTELDYHLREDHPVPAPAAAVEVDDAVAPAALPVTTAGDETGRTPSWTSARLVGMLLAVAAVLVVAYAAVFTSIAAAAVVAAALMALGVIYLRRRRGQPRIPRR